MATPLSAARAEQHCVVSDSDHSDGCSYGEEPNYHSYNIQIEKENNISDTTFLGEMEKHAALSLMGLSKSKSMPVSNQERYLEVPSIPKHIHKKKRPIASLHSTPVHKAENEKPTPAMPKATNKQQPLGAPPSTLCSQNCPPPLKKRAIVVSLHSPPPVRKVALVKGPSAATALFPGRTIAAATSIHPPELVSMGMISTKTEQQIQQEVSQHAICLRNLVLQQSNLIQELSQQQESQSTDTIKNTRATPRSLVLEALSKIHHFRLTNCRPKMIAIPKQDCAAVAPSPTVRFLRKHQENQELKFRRRQNNRLGRQRTNRTLAARNPIPDTVPRYQNLATVSPDMIPRTRFPGQQ